MDLKQLLERSQNLGAGDEKDDILDVREKAHAAQNIISEIFDEVDRAIGLWMEFRKTDKIKVSPTLRLARTVKTHTPTPHGNVVAEKLLETNESIRLQDLADADVFASNAFTKGGLKKLLANVLDLPKDEMKKAVEDFMNSLWVEQPKLDSNGDPVIELKHENPEQIARAARKARRSGSVNKRRTRK